VRSTSYIFSILQVLIFVFSFILKNPVPLIYASLITCILMLLDKLGKGIVLLEIVALFNSFIYLFMPLMGYLFYTKSNPMAFRHIRFMPIPQDQYFELALPAITGFIVLMCWPLSQKNGDEGDAINQRINDAKQVLQGKERIAITLMVIGVLSSLLLPSLPQSFRYIFSLIFLSSFTGLLYLFFSGTTPLKVIYMMLFVIFILIGVLRSGMFTIVAYMGMTVFSFFFLNRKTAFWKKLLMFMMVVFVLVIIQSVKPEYRRQVLGKGKDNQAQEMANLVSKKIEGAGNIISPEFMWPIYYRANQGFYVAMVQNYIPRVKSHDNGEKLLVVFASAFVPRFLWPDKPMAGGLQNMKYYTGFILRGYTMNVGPLGEGYGSFGVTGGILFVMFLGFLIRVVYRQVFVISKKLPLIIFWLPVLFYEVSYSGENDSLQIINSLVKSILFIYIIYKVFPNVLKPSLKNPYHSS
jgi:hypothetical protein